MAASAENATIFGIPLITGCLLLVPGINARFSCWVFGSHLDTVVITGLLKSAGQIQLPTLLLGSCGARDPRCTIANTVSGAVAVYCDLVFLVTS